MSTFSENFAGWKNHRFFTFLSGKLKHFPGIIKIVKSGTCGNPMLQFKEQNRQIVFQQKFLKTKCNKRRRKIKKLVDLQSNYATFSQLSYLRGVNKRSIGVKWVSNNNATPCHAHYLKSWNIANTTKQKNTDRTQQ